MATAAKAPANSRYLELVRAFPLRPLRSAAELDGAIKVVDGLLDKPRLTRDEQDYLDVLSDLIERCEDSLFEFRPVEDGKMLAFLLEAKQVSQSTAAAKTGIPNSVLSNVLHGKRKLNRGQIAKLADYFSVEPTIFDFSTAGAKKRSRKKSD
jgi:HTH-type transcriptional regulator/antitoxin HigA